MGDDSQVAAVSGGDTAPVDTVPSDSGLTADDVQQAVSDALAASERQTEVVTLASADDALRYVPSDFHAFVGGYLTPFLWGIAAGFVAFLIGYLWEAFMRLLGLAARK